MRSSHLLLALLFCPLIVFAQILPKENSKLNYRIIGYSFPEIKQSKKYVLQVAEGRYFSEDSFLKSLVITDTAGTNRIIHEVPKFGVEYTWRITGYDKSGKALRKSGFNHFSTRYGKHADTAFARLRLLQSVDKAHQDYYVSEDFVSTLYDMSGNPVWFLPDTNGLGNSIIDMKCAYDSTITFIYSTPINANLNGDIYWQAPRSMVLNGDSVGIRYHHEFTKLRNGHFMSLGMEGRQCRDIISADTTTIECTKERKPVPGFRRGKFGLILEYDENKNLVWTWNSAEHLIGTDYDYFTPRDSNIKFDPHDNAFYFDEENKVIYLGFRNLNRVMKIEYPSGKVLDIYGDNYKKNQPWAGEGFFCNPHNIQRLPDGNLLYFDNNSCNYSDSLPEIIVAKEPTKKGEEMLVVWRFTLPVEPGIRQRFESGGSVTELPDHTFFVCMGSDYAKMLIVNREGKILWSALPENLVPVEKKWYVHKQDRACIISKKDFEKLVWRAEKEK